MMTLDNLFKDCELYTTEKPMIWTADGRQYETEETVLHEHTIEITVDLMLFAKLVCTPRQLPELVIGRLKTSSLIQSVEDVKRLFICAKGNLAEVSLQSKESRRSVVHNSRHELEGTSVADSTLASTPEVESTLVSAPETEATCCSANHQYLQASDKSLKKLPGTEPDVSAVFTLAGYFKKDSAIHKTTNGTHSAYLRTGDGSIFSFEDIGRHNALDKAVGYMLLNGYEAGECMLYTTGRVPVDMVEKAIASGIPVLVSKSVPTAEAVALAKEYSLTLLCKAWPDSFTRYA